LSLVPFGPDISTSIACRPKRTPEINVDGTAKFQS
jgi:hypothetical protein